MKESLGGTDAILDYAIEREKEAREMYVGYAARTDRKGLRSLLLTMADQEKWHEQNLRELKSGKPAASIFSGSAQDIGLSQYTVEESYSPDMGYQEFLLLVIKKEEKSMALYSRLEAMAADDESKLLFKGLAEEEKRHKALAQDRYDLEILTEN